MASVLCVFFLRQRAGTTCQNIYSFHFAGQIYSCYAEKNSHSRWQWRHFTAKHLYIWESWIFCWNKDTVRWDPSGMLLISARYHWVGFKNITWGWQSAIQHLKENSAANKIPVLHFLRPEAWKTSPSITSALYLILLALLWHLKQELFCLLRKARSIE